MIWPFANQGWTVISYWMMDAFFHEKFLTLFSMLLGMSLFLVGGERSDKQKGRILWRRHRSALSLRDAPWVRYLVTKRRGTGPKKAQERTSAA
jgi:hypothetical protein